MPIPMPQKSTEMTRSSPLQKNDNTENVSNCSGNDSDEGENARYEELEIGQVGRIVFWSSTG